MSRWRFRYPSWWSWGWWVRGGSCLQSNCLTKNLCWNPSENVRKEEEGWGSYEGGIFLLCGPREAQHFFSIGKLDGKMESILWDVSAGEQRLEGTLLAWCLDSVLLSPSFSSFPLSPEFLSCFLRRLGGFLQAGMSVPEQWFYSKDLFGARSYSPTHLLESVCISQTLSTIFGQSIGWKNTQLKGGYQEQPHLLLKDVLHPVKHRSKK